MENDKQPNAPYLPPPTKLKGEDGQLSSLNASLNAEKPNETSKISQQDKDVSISQGPINGDVKPKTPLSHPDSRAKSREKSQEKSREESKQGPPRPMTNSPEMVFAKSKLVYETLVNQAVMFYMLSLYSKLKKAKAYLKSNPEKTLSKRTLHKVGVIGAGNIGKQIINQLLPILKELLTIDNIAISTRRPEQLSKYQTEGVHCIFDNKGMTQSCDFIIFAFPANQYSLISSNLKDISIARFNQDASQSKMMCMSLLTGFNNTAFDKLFKDQIVATATVDSKVIDMYLHKEFMKEVTVPKVFKLMENRVKTVDLGEDEKELVDDEVNLEKLQAITKRAKGMIAHMMETKPLAFIQLAEHQDKLSALFNVLINCYYSGSVVKAVTEREKEETDRKSESEVKAPQYTFEEYPKFMQKFYSLFESHLL